MLGSRIKALPEQKSHPIKNNRNHLVSPTVSDTKLTWLTTIVSLIFRTVLLKFSVHQTPAQALLKQIAGLHSRFLIQEVHGGA